jgi:hypothetical protein
MSQFPEIASNLSTANYRVSELTLLQSIANNTGGSGSSVVTNAGTFAVQNTAATPAGTNSIGSVNPDATGSGSVTTSTPFVVTTTNFGTLAFQSNAVATGTVTIEASVDGTNWTATTYAALTTGNTSSSFNAATATIGQIDVAGFKNIRFRSNTIVGTVGITYNLSAQVSNIMLDNPLPQGTNVIGVVGTQAANGAITMTASSVGTSSATLLAASAATKTLTIQNTSANTLYVSTTTPATALNGIVIGAGVGYQFPYVPTNALYCLGSAASTTYTLWYA